MWLQILPIWLFAKAINSVRCYMKITVEGTSGSEIKKQM